MPKSEPSTDKKSRVVLGREVWTKHFHGYQQSGLTQTQYAEKHGLNSTTFKNWIAKLKREKRQTQSPAFVALKVSPAGSGVAAQDTGSSLQIRLPNGIECTFPAHQAPAQILPWIEYLRVLS
jgi:transposase-like protein